jgi:hypothetical protein
VWRSGGLNRTNTTPCYTKRKYQERGYENQREIIITGVVWVLLLGGFTSVDGEVGGIMLRTIGALFIL